MPSLVGVGGQEQLLAAAKAMLSCLEAIRASNPALIADNMPPGWGMNRVRHAVAERDIASMCRSIERQQSGVN